MSLVGKKFPSIAVDAISEMGDNLKINIFEEAVNNNKKVLLFWYPKDFTFVCPTELHAFQAALPCLLYTSPSPRDLSTSRMPSSA